MSNTQRPSTNSNQYEWRWFGSEPEPQLIPESWTTIEEIPEPAERERRLYAVKCAAGKQLQYGVDDTGTVVSGPHRERVLIEILYASADGSAVIVKGVEGNYHSGEDSAVTTPPSSFSPVIVRPASETDEPSTPNKDHYQTLVEQFYNPKTKNHE